MHAGRGRALHVLLSLALTALESVPCGVLYRKQDAECMLQSRGGWARHPDFETPRRRDTTWQTHVHMHSGMLRRRCNQHLDPGRLDPQPSAQVRPRSKHGWGGVAPFAQVTGSKVKKSRRRRSRGPSPSTHAGGAHGMCLAPCSARFFIAELLCCFTCQLVNKI